MSSLALRRLRGSTTGVYGREVGSVSRMAGSPLVIGCEGWGWGAGPECSPAHGAGLRVLRGSAPGLSLDRACIAPPSLRQLPSSPHCI